MYIRGRYLILALIAAIVISSGVTALLTSGDGTSALPESTTATPEFQKLMETYSTLQKSFYQEAKSDQLLNGAIEGMIKSLDDPYSTYMAPTEAAQFHENIESSFEGIGAEIRAEEGKIVVVSPIKGSPAEKAGVKPNDRIRSVDGKVLDGMTASEAVVHIRGKKGSKAELIIERPGVQGEINISLIRDTIPLETVYSEMLPEQMGKIQITKVSETTYTEFSKALEDLKAQGMKGLIIDVRQNPGGLLNMTVKMVDELLPEGKMILQVEYRNGERDTYKSNAKSFDLPIVVLIDEGTASAAEILASALKESGGVPLVGTKSFGKGTVQTTKQFEDGSDIKYTIAKWLTPDGNWIHKNGIEPDYKVELPAYASLPAIDPEKELKQEQFSNEVKAAQTMLDALGFHPGRVDGFFDNKTTEAVTAFQKANNIEATGTIQGKTTTKMMELLHEKLKKNDTQLEMAQRVLRKLIP
ncbi:peptidase S41 [Tumebacillus algifaecis]|uniref:Peptidase S41 n=2 Tax=Tumebacillus algifaecis TaxID=1214604 RepID=A0A223D5C3_9BACL|nr:peptidase S41 [Tumebacillus algifaecis]